MLPESAFVLRYCLYEGPKTTLRTVVSLERASTGASEICKCRGRRRSGSYDTAGKVLAGSFSICKTSFTCFGKRQPNRQGLFWLPRMLVCRKGMPERYILEEKQYNHQFSAEVRTRCSACKSEVVIMTSAGVILSCKG